MSDLPGRLRNQAEGLLDEWNSEELALLLTEAADTIARQAAAIGRVEALASIWINDGYLNTADELRAALGDEK